MPLLATNIIPHKPDNTQLEKLFSCCNTLNDSVKILKDSINRYEAYKEKKKISIVDSANDNRT